jgi:pectinesterase
MRRMRNQIRAHHLLIAAVLLSPVSAQAQAPGWPAWADAVVAADGSGQFKSVQEAIAAAPTARADKRWVIYIKAGTYKERLYIQREKRFLSLVGEDAEKTILTYDLSANMPGPDGKPIGTFRTPSALIDADDFAASNLTFENSAGLVGQALAVRIDGDRVLFRDCRFLGWQDTILANRGRHAFERCYIAGHVDFIFGGATAYFQDCHIHCLKDGYITAASTPDNQPYGFVFSGGKVTGDAGVKTYLGRPWRSFAHTAFLNVELSSIVRPEGWHNWSHPEREATARYAEFQSRGEGANAQARVAWSRQLDPAEAQALTMEKVLAGTDGWNPKAIEIHPSGHAAATAPPSPVAGTEAGKCAVSESDVEYGRAERVSLRLDACLPAGTGPFPAAILVHGGGWMSGDKAEAAAPLREALTRAGIAWFSINYRLAPQSRYPAPVEDVEAAIRWLKVHAGERKVDPGKLALVGESAGGHLVALAAVRARGETAVAAVVPFYAPVDLVSDTERRGGLSVSMRALFGRTELDEVTRAILRDASPINAVSAESPSFLLVHGTADMSVPYEQSQRMQQALRAVGVTCDLITIQDGRHGMTRWESLDVSYKDAVSHWLAQRLSAAGSR